MLLAAPLTDTDRGRPERRPLKEDYLEEKIPDDALLDVVELAARVEAAGPVGYLVKPLWSGDGYGVLGAEDKAGKTWAVVDLAVSVAIGGDWFSRYPCEAPGSVAYYAGEGGARNIVRRFRAVCEWKGVPFEALAGRVRVSERVPHLTNTAAVEAVAADLAANPGTRLVIVDPLYLAARGSKGSDLYGMADALVRIQYVCQAAGAALVIVHHWNKGGSGSGAQRFTGVGPSAWGRVLGSAEVESKALDAGGRSTVTLRWEFSGSEIPETAFRIRRVVWADDPDDLSSPLHYEVAVTGEGLDTGGYAAMAAMPPAQQRVLNALGSSEIIPTWSVADVGDYLARDGMGKPLKKTTIQNTLAILVRDGYAVKLGPDAVNQPARWMKAP